jgi:hypothetical protein
MASRNESEDASKPEDLLQTVMHACAVLRNEILTPQPLSQPQAMKKRSDWTIHSP